MRSCGIHLGVNIYILEMSSKMITLRLQQHLPANHPDNGRNRESHNLIFNLFFGAV